MNPYFYVDGESEQPCYAGCLNTCGNCIGFLKTWLPCCPCLFCCWSSPFQVVKQGFKGIVTRFNKFQKIVEPGLIYINPITQGLEQIDCRMNVIDLDRQNILTKDNISLQIDACVYYTITQPKFSSYRIADVKYSVSQLTYAILKNTAGTFLFQQLLQKRNDIANDIQKQIEPVVKNWGIKINEIYFKDYVISNQLEMELNAVPRAVRDAESTIISARADVQIARMLSSRSKLLDSNTAMQIRYLDTLKHLSSKQTCTVIYTPGHH